MPGTRTNTSFQKKRKDNRGHKKKNRPPNSPEKIIPGAQFYKEPQRINKTRRRNTRNTRNTFPLCFLFFPFASLRLLLSEFWPSLASSFTLHLFAIVVPFRCNTSIQSLRVLPPFSIKKSGLS